MTSVNDSRSHEASVRASTQPQGDRSTKRGGVVLLHEIWGRTRYIEDTAAMLAHAGYDTVAPDLFRRTGGNQPHDHAEAAPHLARLSDDDVLADLNSALEELRVLGHDDASIAVLGMCLGGRFAFLAATTKVLGAAVSFYPTGIVVPTLDNLPPLANRVSDLRAPWLCLLAADDRVTAASEMDQLWAAAGEAQVDTSFVRFADVRHGFHNPTRPDRYDPRAAGHATARALDWLTSYLA
jgi:carboxymethylenebutenolidase